MKGKLGKTVLAGGLCLLVAVPAALGEDMTREEYVARVEPICKSNTDSYSDTLKGVKDQIKNGKLAAAGRRFAIAARAYGKAVNRIAAVPQPPADAEKLGRWLGYLRLEKTYLDKITKALKAGQRFQSELYVVKLTRNVTRANNVVVSFGFHYCRVNPSKFT